MLSDFEFLEANGKNLCIPAKSAKLEWTGRAVKELAGSGSIYVRLCTEKEGLATSSSEPESEGSVKEPEVKITKFEKGLLLMALPLLEKSYILHICHTYQSMQHVVYV